MPFPLDQSSFPILEANYLVEPVQEVVLEQVVLEQVVLVEMAVLVELAALAVGQAVMDGNYRALLGLDEFLDHRK